MRPKESVEEAFKRLLAEMHRVDCDKGGQCDEHCEAWSRMLGVVEAKMKQIVQKMFPAEE